MFPCVTFPSVTSLVTFISVHLCDLFLYLSHPLVYGLSVSRAMGGRRRSRALGRQPLIRSSRYTEQTPDDHVPAAVTPSPCRREITVTLVPACAEGGGADVGSGEDCAQHVWIGTGD